MYLFNEVLENWNDWSHVFQSIEAFEPLIREIETREGLPHEEIGHLTPGTNAVFRIGAHVIKIYAPKETGMDQTADRLTEIRTLKLAESLGIFVPSVMAEGIIRDRYDFAYILMKYIDGISLEEVLKTSDADRQCAFGAQLRRITDAWNVPVEPFNDIDVLHDPYHARRWADFPESFREERERYLSAHDFGPLAYVHGDLCMDNILVSAPSANRLETPSVTGASSGLQLSMGGAATTLIPIDFADSVLAPVCYEHALVFFEFLDYPEFLKAYFAGTEDPVLDVFSGILMHSFGGPIIRQTWAEAKEFTRLPALWDAVEKLVTGLLN